LPVAALGGDMDLRRLVHPHPEVSLVGFPGDEAQAPAVQAPVRDADRSLAPLEGDPLALRADERPLGLERERSIGRATPDDLPHSADAPRAVRVDRPEGYRLASDRQSAERGLPAPGP